MGSGLGPAGPTMSASYRELKALRALPAMKAYAIRHCRLTFRWMDDVWQIWRASMPADIKQALADLRAPRFYGDGLLLGDTNDDVSFGFKYRQSKGLLRVRQHLTFVSTFEEGKAAKKWPAAHGPDAFMAEKAKAGILQGYCPRVLDFSNEPAEIIVREAERVLSELRASGHHPALLRKAWAKTRRKATKPLPDLPCSFDHSPLVAHRKNLLLDLQSFVSAPSAALGGA